MGFLDDGTPLAWKDSLQYLDYVRRHGVKQFISTYNKVKDRKNDKLLWGMLYINISTCILWPS